MCIYLFLVDHGPFVCAEIWEIMYTFNADWAFGFTVVDYKADDF